MTLSSIVFLLFVLLESFSIVALFFFPGSTKANAPGIFKAFEASKKDPEIHQFILYLIYWIGGCKLIFAILCIVIALTGSPALQFWASLGLLLSIATFFWHLYPLIRIADKRQQLNISGYSKSLFWMIMSILICLALSLAQQLL